MARIRTIKPDFYRHEALQDMEIAHPGKYPMMVFAGLWTQCDKNGSFEWKPRQLKLDILPFLPFDMAETLAILEQGKQVIRYSVDGKEYGFIPSFKDHQRINGKESTEPSRFPEYSDEYIVKQQGSSGEATEKQLRSQEGKGRGKEEEGKRKGTESSAEQVGTVFAFWKSTMGHEMAVLDDKRRKVIAERLKDGYSVDSLCKAISGCFKSAWHMGMNDRGTRYDGLDLILRDGAKVDQFIGFDVNPPRAQGKQAQLESVNKSVFDEFVNGPQSTEKIIEGEVMHA